MDSKIIFVKTRKGEDEIRGKTANLYSDIKRVLLMVDGSSTLGEISKRAVPSLRRALDEMIKELANGGFIEEQNKAAKSPTLNLATPSGMHSPIKKPMAEVSELDFTSALSVEADRINADKLRMKAEAESRVRVEVEAKARQEIEAAKLKEQQAAEAQARAELEAARAKEKAEAQARALVEENVKREVEALRIKNEMEAKARVEAEAKARQEIEAAKLKEQQQAAVARARAELEASKAKALAEANARALAEENAKREAEALRIKNEMEAKARAEAEAKAKQEIEAAKLREEQLAAVARARAELDATKAQALAEARARALAEENAKREAEALRIKNEMEANARAEAEAKARQEIEAAKLKEQQAAAARALADEKAKRDAEALRIKTEAEAKEAAEVEAKQEIEAARLKALQVAETERLNAEQEFAKAAAQVAEASSLNKTAKSKSMADPSGRSTSATVLFFDVVGYTKHPVNKQIEVKKQFTQLVSDCLEALGDGERIILDTGDGAAIGFLQHPEDALEAAMQFRNTVMGGQNQSFADLKVRIGIHLGPISVVKDMNGQSNMVGDGINDAQRVMGFAGVNQIYISRPYYDFISRLSEEYAELFQYRGSQKDKHGREHPVYELVDAVAPEAESTLPRYDDAAPALKLDPFSFAMPRAEISPVPVKADKEPEVLLPDAVPVTPKQPSPVTKESAAPAAEPAAGADKIPLVERSPSEDEVKELEGTQAKVWADAQQRAIESAKANAQRALQSQQIIAPVAQDVPVARVKRKPIPWGKVGAGLFVMLVIALFAVPYVMPMKDYVHGIEKLLTEKLQQSVHIGNMSGRLLPTPRLELSDVSIGDLKQLQARQAQVNFSIPALFTETKAINNVELKGVQVNGAVLPQVSIWFRQVAADAKYPIKRIGLSEGTLEADGIQLKDIGGELKFDRVGVFVAAKLHAMGNKYDLDINAAPEEKLHVSIAVRGSALPFFPSWVFDELNARGELTGDALVITELDSRIMGGTMTGSARVSWRSGWRAQGSLVAQAITLQKLSQALSGDMDGTAQFQMQAANLPSLAETASMDGTFTIKKGVVNGIDVVETARLRSKTSLPGGRTHFDELSGSIFVAKNSYAFRQLRMSSGVLNAKGTLDITKQQLSGSINADLAASTGIGLVTLQLGGTAENPTLRAGR